jgi:hypothetical protein
MSRRVVVLFTGDPKRESARKGLPAGLLHALHGQLVSTIRRSGVPIIVASDARGTFVLDDGHGRCFLSSRTFAEKVEGAFRFAFDQGFDSVVLLAGDVAGIDPRILAEAFARLDAAPHTSVIGKSGDGGFYLLGLERGGLLPAAVSWKDVAWFTPSAAESVTKVLHAAGADVSFLPALDDIDCRADALRVIRALPQGFALLRARMKSLLAASRPPAPRRTTFVSVVLDAAALLRASPAI